MKIKNIHYFLLFFCGIITIHSFAVEKVLIPVSTDKFVLLMETDNSNRLLMSYFGEKLQNTSEYQQIIKQNRQADGNGGIFNHVYTPAGTWNLVQPALSIKHADGNISTELNYLSHTNTQVSENVTLTEIKLADPVYKTEVILHFQTFLQENVFEQWTTIKNNEKNNIVLNNFASANLTLQAKEFHLTSFYGGWASEMRPECSRLTHGIKTIDSKLGTRANLFSHPLFILGLNGPANENQGLVMLGHLAWSGNFKIDFEIDPYKNLRILPGINPFQSSYPLLPGKEFKTPSFIYTFSENGISTASCQLHDWARKYRLKNGNGDRLTLLNNWEATYFDFNEKKISELFVSGKKLGVDLFLLDDGWFANKYPRNNDRAGLGDWEPNRQKLPNGIGYLVKEAEKTGIRFGIWLEPEMVNPKSELYEKHPDWVIKNPDRPEQYFRNQLVLDLTNPDVQKYIFDIVDKLMSENPGIAYIKWDCNSVIFNANSAYLKKSNQSQSQLYIDYVKGLYLVLERIRNKYPDIPMMLCSGGGGRVDYEALKYFTEYWPSDNTDPKERVYIQWNYSYFYPSIASCNHITDWSQTSLKYKTDVAFMGKPGYDIVVNQLKENDLKFSQDAMKLYKSIKETIWHGKMYRLASPYENPYACVQYVNQEKTHAVFLGYLTGDRFGENSSSSPVLLKGLKPESLYRLSEINLYPGQKSVLADKMTITGDFLMKIGINPVINTNRTSVVIELKEM